MNFLKPFFFTFILALAKCDVKDCTVTEVNELVPILNSCANILVGDLNVPSTGDLPVFNLNGQTLTFKGKVTFDARYEDSEPLLTITGRDFLVQNGPDGIIDGNGALYWDGKGILSETRKPVLIKIDTAYNASFLSLSVMNCPQTCVEISKSHEIIVKGWNIDVKDGEKDGLGVDTHGFTFKNSSAIQVKNIIIYNQGDCLTINQGSSMKFYSIQCVGSQALSIRPEWTYANFIGNISFEYMFLTKTKSGIQVVTSPDQPKGVIEKISFKNIQVADTRFEGIEIRQDFGNEGRPEGNIKISDLNITTVTGYMTNKYLRAVYINCGTDGCTPDWYWSGIDIQKAEVENSCNFLPNGFDCW